MAHSSDDSSLQAKFDEQADGLGLALEQPEDRTKFFGLAFLMLDDAAVRTEAADTEVAEELREVDEQAIQALLYNWESRAPEQLVAEWRQFATDPYIGVGDSWAGVITQQTYDAWLQSERRHNLEKDAPPYSPRRITISNVNIVYILPTKAVVTYRVEEQYKNGRRAAGNTAVILFNVKDKGWRIAVDNKGGRV